MAETCRVSIKRCKVNTICEGSLGVVEWREVDADETSTPGLVVHFIRPNRYNVTASSNGICVGWAKSEKGARLFAAVCGGLPIDWTKLPKVTHSEAMLKIVQQIKTKLTKNKVPEFYQWFCDVYKNGCL